MQGVVLMQRISMVHAPRHSSLQVIVSWIVIYEGSTRGLVDILASVCIQSLNNPPRLW